MNVCRNGVGVPTPPLQKKYNMNVRRNGVGVPVRKKNPPVEMNTQKSTLKRSRGSCTKKNLHK